MSASQFQTYLSAVTRPFLKLVRLRFLNPDGSTAFVLDNNPYNKRSGAFIQEGSLRVNLQNGQRRTATVKLSNVDGTFDYNVNRLWFGQQVALDEGMVLPDGSEFYIQQGIFLLDTPAEELRPGERTITYNLVDKWANLDGSLFGNLESIYEVPVGTNIFTPILSLLQEDMGNGVTLDSEPPVFTNYYNDKTQIMPDGTEVSLSDTAYTLRIDSEGGTIADVFLGLAGMVNAWIGYDRSGALRIDASQDDISDSTKPVAWRFSLGDFLFLGASYTIKNTEVYNDYIVIGEQMDDFTQPYGRATNTDLQSDTCVTTIGRKTIRVQQAGFSTDTQCVDLAVWKLKRSSALQKAITISCGQLFHINENEIVEIVRTDKPGQPVERHLILGFTRPLAGTDQMTIDAVSVNDLEFGYTTEDGTADRGSSSSGEAGGGDSGSGDMPVFDG